MAESFEISIIEAGSGTQWNYTYKDTDSGPEIVKSFSSSFVVAFAQDSTARTSYSVTLDGTVARTGVPTSESSAELYATNATASLQTVQFGEGRASMAVPLVSGASISADIGLDFGTEGGPLSGSLSITGDPLFSVSPAKPPDTVTEVKNANTDEIIWNGSSWSKESVISNSGWSLSVVNNAESVDLKIDHGEQSQIIVPFGAGATLTIEFGSAYTLSGGTLTVNDAGAALDVYPPPGYVQSPEEGESAGGSEFDDAPQASYRIVELLIWTGKYKEYENVVLAIQTNWSDGSGTTVQGQVHGAPQGTPNIITLSASQYITAVSGKSGTFIDQLTFTDNNGTSYGPYGGTGGGGFGPVQGVLGGFFGSSGTVIDKLGFWTRDVPG